MPSGIAARSAACSTGLIRTVGGADFGSTVSKPACSSAVRARSLLAGTPPPPERNSPAAGAARTAWGMPCPSSSAARASSSLADPSGDSWSARPNKNIHVTAAADGRPLAASASCSRRRTK